MNTRFFLREQNGSNYIHADITGNGLRLKASTGVQINSVKDWNEKKKEVRGTDLNSIACNQKLRDIENTVDKLTTTHSLSGEELTSEVLKTEVLKVTAPHRLKNKESDINRITNLLRLVEDFIDNKRKKVSANTMVNKNTFKGLLQGYVKKYGLNSVDFKNIDFNFEEKFTKFLFSDYNYNINSLDGIKAQIAAFMNFAVDRGLTTNMTFKKFSREKVEVDTIALTNEEVDGLYNLKLESRPDADIRDMFCFTCLTGLRFSDVILVNGEKRTGDYLNFQDIKTGKFLTVPLRAKAIKILKRHNNKFYKISNSHYNKRIKEVAKQLPVLQQSVEIHTTKGGVRKDVIVKKWEIVSSHTGRRTFATNAIKAGIPAHVVMKITGHKTYAAFQRYIRIDGQMSAELMMNEFKKIDNKKAA
ncbi:MAG TPA: tyrosine-type recombinase/integrase [Bacteroidia bacterium]|nr:tyrosine-type recombinase/integrase [Bacteroidia bacterium]